MTDYTRLVTGTGWLNKLIGVGWGLTTLHEFENSIFDIETKTKDLYSLLENITTMNNCENITMKWYTLERYYDKQVGHGIIVASSCEQYHCLVTQKEVLSVTKYPFFVPPKTNLAKAMKFKSSVPVEHVLEEDAEWIFEVITMHDQSELHPDDVDPVIDCCVEELKMYYSLCEKSLESRDEEWEQRQNDIIARSENILKLKNYRRIAVIDEIKSHLNGENPSLAWTYEGWSREDFRKLLKLIEDENDESNQIQG